MKRGLSFWQISGFVFSSIGGTILHFLYDWSNESVFVAPFSGVNESTWEHMKLLFFPMFIFALIQNRFFKYDKSFWCVKLLGTIVGLTMIPLLFYMYNGLIGKSPDWINIAIFFISAAVAYITEYKKLKNGTVECEMPNLAFATICIIGMLFVVFTFLPPETPLFRDPITGTYGLYGGI